MGLPYLSTSEPACLAWLDLDGLISSIKSSSLGELAGQAEPEFGTRSVGLVGLVGLKF